VIPSHLDGDSEGHQASSSGDCGPVHEARTAQLIRIRREPVGDGPQKARRGGGIGVANAVS
jgi:hypothetical protein